MTLRGLIRMNSNFAAYVHHAQETALSKGLSWKMPVDEAGKVPKAAAWDLSAPVGAPPPRALLADLGQNPKALKALNERRSVDKLAPVDQQPLSDHWQDFIKAAAIDQVFIRRNQPAATLNNVIRPLRIIATCAPGVEPWELTSDHIRLAHDIALSIAASGQYAVVLFGVTRDLIDRNNIADRSPLLPHVSGVDKQQRKNVASVNLTARSDDRRAKSLRKSLSERKDAAKLPDHRAFWELIRIAFTETPRTFADNIRFAQIKLQVLCGFRIGELCVIPADWRRTRDYVDADGRPAGELGGVSRSLMIRHFAEKQRGEDENSVMLYEAFQHVPTIFEEIIEETMAAALLLTDPLRHRLRAQTETGRIFPELPINQLVQAADLFTRMTGSLQVSDREFPTTLVDQYRASYDASVLDQLRHDNSNETGFSMQFLTYWAKLSAQKPLPMRDHHGAPWKGRAKWNGVYFFVSEMEKYIRESMPTKLSDVLPLQLANGNKIYPHELLFLAPKRALIEERNRSICDITRYFAVGPTATADLMGHLGGKENNLFNRYGQTEEDRQLTLTSHSLRHLQNTELFRLGVADTIITKRFNRRSVQQSYVYDHRSLAEDLDRIDLPPTADILNDKSALAYKMMKAGKIKGRLVREFEGIQKQYGEEAAFAYLSVEADGFHTTPYGYCINSFVVDPCPKHLECFGGCRHFAMSEQDEHRRNLTRTADQLRKAIEMIEARPSESIGRDNQLKHARTRLNYIEVALAAESGSRPFHDGPDLSVIYDSRNERSVLDV